MKPKSHLVVGGVMLLVAGSLAYLATRGVAGPVSLSKYVELREGPLQEHLVSVDELNMGRNFRGPHFPLHYPSTVAPGITSLVSDGFTPLYTPTEAQAAALPAEQAW